MIETSRAEGGTSRTVAPPTNGQHPHPSSFPPREWQQRVGMGCAYLDISTWRYHVTAPGGSPAGTEQEPRSGPLRWRSTGGNRSQLLSYRLWLFHAYKIPGQQDLRVDSFYVTEIHIGCKRCVTSIGAAQHRAVGWWPEGRRSSNLHGRLGPGDAPAEAIPKGFLRSLCLFLLMQSAVAQHTTSDHSPLRRHGPAVPQQGPQPSSHAPGTSPLPQLLLPPERPALLQGLLLARQSFKTGWRK